MSSDRSSGRCNCGSFQFSVPKHDAFLMCFCKCCVRAGGSFCSANAVIPADGIEFTKGSLKDLNKYEDKETTSGNPMARYFCGSCGSAIISIPQDSPVGFFKYSTLDDPESYTAGKDPNMAIFTKEAPKWSQRGGSGIAFPEGTKCVATAPS